jgi:hypothetical protein
MDVALHVHVLLGVCAGAPLQLTHQHCLHLTPAFVTGGQVAGGGSNVPTGGCVLLTAQRGVMPDAEFRRRMQGRCQGRVPSRRDPGRNCPLCIIPYWCESGQAGGGRLGRRPGLRRHAQP